MSEPRILRFGVYEVDLASRELRKRGVRVHLQDQPFRVLEALLERAGELVTRDELKERLWAKDEFVEFDRSLNAAVQRIRHALGDDANSPRFIETVPRQGYKFVAPVQGWASSGQEPGPPRSPGRVRKLVVFAGVAGALLAGGAVWWLTRPDDRTFEADNYTLRRLTSDGGLAYQPSLSRDGKLVVYASDRAGEDNLDIWVQQTAGGDPIQLTSDAADEFEPAFSPDGSQVVFRSKRVGGGIYIVPALGGEPRLLARDAYRPRFSPDGKRIAYWHGQEHVPGWKGSWVYVLELSSGESTRLGFGRSPVWSPDGNAVLYSRAVGEARTTEWVFHPLGGGELVVTDAVEAAKENGLGGDPRLLWQPVFLPETWLRDGTVLFSASSGQAFNVWALPMDPASGAVLGAPVPVTNGSAEHRFASAVPGGRIAFADVEENYDIWMLPLDANRGAAAGPPERIVSTTGFDAYPSLPLDGQALIFKSDRTGSRQGWTRNLSTGEEKPLGRVSGFVAASHGPYATAWRSKERPLTYDTYEINLVDGAQRLLCEDCGLPSDWSRSGRLLVGYGGSAAGRAAGISEGLVTLTDLASGQSSVLRRTMNADWRFSPDEKWLAFHRRAADDPEIRQVMVSPIPEQGPVEDDELIAITDGTANSFRADWSPDGSLVYYGSERDGYTCIYAQPVDARKHPVGPPIEVFHAHGARISMSAIRNPGALGLSVARDKMAFTMAEVTGEIWIMEPRDGE